jgi:DNA invertase Pin-like site-specific DNA recombinase
VTALDTAFYRGRLTIIVFGGLAEFKRELIWARSGEDARAPRR